MDVGEARLHKLREKMTESSVDAFLISNYTNWRYISGFRGDAGLVLVTHKSQYVFTDSRYVEEAQNEAPAFNVIMTTVDADKLKETISCEDIRKIAFEKDHVTYANWENLQKRLPDVQLVPVSGWVEKLRMVKTPEEIVCITKAQEIADAAFESMKPSIRKGAREMDLALELEFAMRKMGAEGPSFSIIVVSGERSSLPHGVPSEKKLADGDFLTIDFGAKYNGYCSDETRTFVIGHLDEKHKEIYEVVLRAQLAGLEAVKPGVKGKDVDAAGREVIEEAGYGQYFGHGIGHGVGLQIHEGPGARKASEDILEPGMVVTVEPGIYIPGFGGCRIEDLVLVTETGHEVLSKSPKDLEVIGK